MTRLARWVAQFLCLAAIGGLIGLLSVAPAYTHRAPGAADIKLSLSHGAPRVDCRQRTAEEIARLPPQMRRPNAGPRQRLPLRVVFRLDGTMLLDIALPPGGLAGDGPSRLYRTFPVSAGPHHLAVYLRDTARESGFDYTLERTVEVAPGQNLVIDFQPADGGFYFR